MEMKTDIYREERTKLVVLRGMMAKVKEIKRLRRIEDEI
jgi:hypothetical protein